MKSFLLIAAAIFGPLFCPGVPYAAGGPIVVDRIVAVVNDEIITLSDLQREASKKNAGMQDEHLLLEDLIDKKLQLSAAKRAGITVSDLELRDAVDDIMKRNSVDRKQFDAELSGDGLTFDQYQAELREQITLSRAFNKYVRAGLVLDDAELRAYYEHNQKAYAQPEEIRVRQIFIKLPDDAAPGQAAAVKVRARSAFERARAGEDFIKLVREFSEGGNAVADGDLGYMRRDHAQPVIEQATQTLKPGEIAGPLLSAGGYHIIRLEEIRTPVAPFAKVKDGIQAALYQQKLENAYRTWLQALRGDTHIENRL